MLTGSFTIGTGSKTFNKSGEIEDIAVGAIVRIVSDINSPANFMAGAVTAVTGTTITVNVDEVGGIGERVGHPGNQDQDQRLGPGAASPEPDVDGEATEDGGSDQQGDAGSRHIR